MVNRGTNIRSHKNFSNIINFIRAKYLLEGKKPPTQERITGFIAKRIDKEELLRDLIIKF